VTLSPPIFNDTIAAIATAPGEAGLAVLRVSGPRALAVADACFVGRSPLADVGSHTLHHGWVVWPSTEPALERRRLDEAVAGVFRAPRSYTREDVVELSCHGGGVAARRVLAALLAAGARLARPGEFTLRAYLGGRLDLTQAEAVADLIHAETDAAGDLALAQLAGGLSRRIGTLADRLMDCVAEVEARVDFAEDVGGVEVPPHVVAAIERTRADLATLLEGSEYARAVRDGVRVTIAGRPNAGKSSLFNALLGESRAIVTDVAGTTRDRVSERLELDGVWLVLSDTAGLRASDDPIERMGVQRATESLEAAGLVLWVVDGSQSLAPEDLEFHEQHHGRRVLWVLNKSDLGVSAEAVLLSLRTTEDITCVRVSALTGDGLVSLREAIVTALGGARGGLLGQVSNPRHAEALERAARLLAQASVAAGSRAPGEIVALELRESLAAFGEVTGTHMGDELLDRIFSRFCIGK